ncbi:oligosaccharide repeat unit polymerase [Halalkalicoccus sp. GCM10025322]|uniref:oligosaccharide repeat unit polymerase n=2 Tax=Halococcaceae TaxID=1963270 RepID=UPI002F968311
MRGGAPNSIQIAGLRLRLLIFGGFLSLLGIGIGLFFTDKIQVSQFTLLFSGFAIVMVIPWVISLWQGKLDFFDPLIFKSGFIFMIGVVLFDYVYLRTPEYIYDEITFSYYDGIWLVGVLYLSYFTLMMVTYYTVAIYFRDKRILEEVFPLKQFNHEHLRLFALLYFLLGLIAYVALFLQIAPDGNIFLLYTSTTPRSEIFAGHYLLTTLTNCLYLGYFLWLLSTIVAGRALRISQLMALVPVLGGLSLLGGRATVIKVVLVTVIFTYYNHIKELTDIRHPLIERLDRINPILRLILLPIIGLGIICFLIAAQAARQAESPIKAIQSVDLVTILTAGVHNTSLEHFLLLLEMVPSEKGYYYGTFFGRVVTNMIPSAIWPEKPVMTVGSLLRRTIDPSASGGWPPGEMGIWYINFGFPGIAIGAIIYGAILRLLYEALYTNRSSPLVILLYSITLVHIIPIGLANNEISALLFDLILLSPLFVVIVLVNELK